MTIEPDEGLGKQVMVFEFSGEITLCNAVDLWKTKNLRFGSLVDILTPASFEFPLTFFPNITKYAELTKKVVWTATPRLAADDYHRAIDLGPAVTPGIYLLETRLDGRAFLRKIEVR